MLNSYVGGETSGRRDDDWLSQITGNPFWQTAGQLSPSVQQNTYGMTPNIFSASPGATSYRNPEAFLNQGPLTSSWGAGGGAGGNATGSSAAGGGAAGGGAAGGGASGASTGASSGGLAGLGAREWLALAGSIPLAVNAFRGGDEVPYGSEMERLIAELTRQQQQADPLRQALLAWAQGLVPTYARG